MLPVRLASESAPSLGAHAIRAALGASGVADDVVNEVIDGDGRLRDNLWLRGIGPEYIGMAFEFAHEADPRARLYINDYLTETLTPKSDGVFNTAYLLRALGAPVHGIGIQMHRFLVLPESASEIEANLRRISDAGIDVYITEMDVAIPLPADAALLLSYQACTDTACLSPTTVRLPLSVVAD